jgi:hypothetical protein
MPQNTGGILQHANIDSDFSGIILYCRPAMSIGNIEQFPQFAETRETPITLLSYESVVSI